MIEIFLSLAFIAIAQWIIKNIPVYWLRRLAGAIFAAILGGFLAFGFLEDSFFSFLIVLPGFLYLCLLPIRVEKKEWKRQIQLK